MTFYDLIFQEWPFILRLIFLLSIFFLIISLMIMATMYYQRIVKNLKYKSQLALENILLNFINSYLFDEDFNKDRELIRLKKTNLQSDFHLKIAIKQLLIFNENLKGESKEVIKHLFISLGLFDYTIKQLNTSKWQRKARCLYVLSQLSIKIPDDLIDPLINHKKIEVRQQAILFILNLSEHNPLDFFNKMKNPLTLWQQIYVEHALKNTYIGEIPDFSQWLNHKMESIVLFSIKMISEFNQFQNIPKLISLLTHTKESVRVEAIRSLSKMQHDSLIPTLISRFYTETLLIKQEILRTIKHKGNYKQLMSIGLGIYQENNSIKVNYFRIEYYFRSKITFNFRGANAYSNKASLTM